MPNTPHGAQSPELQKLAEKFRKDPTSKLFFPLAEEYLKIGKIDQAIDLLRQGKKAHPHFLSARVALGKALLQKGLQAEAQAEFEHVIAANPDNLLAHKKLAGIYCQIKNRAAAKASCDAVLAIHPSDPDILRILDDVNQLPGDAADEPTVVDATADEPTVIGSAQADERTAVGPAVMEEATVVDAVRVQSSTQDDPARHTSAMGTPALVVDLASARSMIEPTALAAVPDAADAVPEPDPADDDPTAVGAPAAGSKPDGLATISLADLYVAQGHYERAVAIYRQILARTPDHAEAAAKLDNAETLARLLTPQRQEGEALKTHVVQQVLGGSDRSEEPFRADREQDASLAAIASGGSRHAAAIERLEAWLARIERRRGA